ncbi:MAG: hypothetical protein K9J27_02515 [Bacteroidales bacterium]|nr:hypothetical protein [Bacteroidales bacterium]MCF8332928.1 hypothetical protein [Bacteroidales bacterium]
MILRKSFFIIVVFLLALNSGQAQDVLQPAREHFNKFDDVDGGWCAADGTISYELPDGKTLWLFGDTFVGEKDGEFSIDNSTATFVNNTAILEDNGDLVTYHGGTEENPSAFIPRQGEDWFWPKHMILEGDTLRIFTLKIRKKDDGTPGFNFEVGTAHISSFTYPALEHVRTSRIEQITDTTMRFGTQVLEKDGYVYIYGKKIMSDGNFQWKIPYLARTENSVTGQWEFYAGNGDWSPECDSAAPIGDRPVGETFYVWEEENGFYMLMHETFLVDELVVLKADELTGPFNAYNSGGTENTFAIIEEAGNYNTYNLGGHPQFNENGKLLISFNVNAHDFGSIYQDTRNYRGRFYWCDVEETISVSPPDTVRIFDDFTGTSSNESIERTNQDYFNVFEKRAQLRNLRDDARLNIYGINGQKYLSKEVRNNEIISLSQLPRQLLILELVTDDTVVTRKMMRR